MLTEYTQRTDEPTKVYFEKITTQLYSETDEQYEYRLARLSNLFFDLPLWYNITYIQLTRRFYLMVYSQPGDLTKLQFLRLIFIQGAAETDVVYFNRINFIRFLLPDLINWNDPGILIDYYRFVTKYYKLLFEKLTSESQNDYYKRMFIQHEEETNREYIIRISLFRKIYWNLSVWNSKRFLRYTRTYYQSVFAKSPKESTRKWVLRITRKYYIENTDGYKKRMELVQTIFTNVKEFKKKNIKFNRGKKKLLLLQVSMFLIGIRF